MYEIASFLGGPIDGKVMEIEAVPEHRVPIQIAFDPETLKKHPALEREPAYWVHVYRRTKSSNKDGRIYRWQAYPRTLEGATI